MISRSIFGLVPLISSFFATKRLPNAAGAGAIRRDFPSPPPAPAPHLSETFLKMCEIRDFDPPFSSSRLSSVRHSSARFASAVLRPPLSRSHVSRPHVSRLHVSRLHVSRPPRLRPRVLRPPVSRLRTYPLCLAVLSLTTSRLFNTILCATLRPSSISITSCAA